MDKTDCPIYDEITRKEKALRDENIATFALLQELQATVVENDKKQSKRISNVNIKLNEIQKEVKNRSWSNKLAEDIVKEFMNNSYQVKKKKREFIQNLILSVFGAGGLLTIILNFFLSKGG
ncbi:MAG: hypothetical protein PWP15_1120 [Methanothermococcus sp.]|uniref:hypothetical protein n=1 Tax=Methanothermococcus sp. TaxID=2614238 RepID=UPI0025835A64|nr:hypothetical protein [Methanothermococcus sp.]MDK2790613.1 hypothetical protein [Methanothermococcus sp.]